MTQPRTPTPLTNKTGMGITANQDWAAQFTLGGIVTAIHSARMEIRKTVSPESPIIASFYSDGTGTGELTIDALTITVKLPSSVSGAAGFDAAGPSQYDMFAICDLLDIGSNERVQVAFGPVDVNSRVTQ